LKEEYPHANEGEVVYFFSIEWKDLYEADFVSHFDFAQ